MFLGIDIGTSSVKTVVVDEAGAVAAQASVALAVDRPHPLWSEQEPDHWWAATDQSVRSLPATLRSKVQAVGLAGQMHGATLLGADDRPLRPAILWNDGRAFAECAELESRAPSSRDITGNLAMPGFTAPKLLWMKAHEPALFDRLHSVVLPKDYVRLRMTGDKISDLSDSAGTLWLDCARRDWSDTMLAASGLSRSMMPRLVEGCAPAGRLRAAVAADWGMAALPVAGGGGDNAAGAAGIGVIDEGDAFLSLGTSGVIFVATRAFRPNPAGAVHAFCHCLPDRWHQMSVILSAAASLDWAARLIGCAGAPALLELAERAGPGAGPELFLPYLSGERTPHNDPHVRGGFLGLDNDSGPEKLAQAVIEGVAFALADGLDALTDAGTAVDALSMIGGGAQSHYWGSVIAAVLGVPLHYIDDGDVGPALGAAKLARLAIGGGTIAEICKKPAVRAVIEPDQAIADRLAPQRARFRAAYRHMASI